MMQTESVHLHFHRNILIHERVLLCLGCFLPRVATSISQGKPNDLKDFLEFLRQMRQGCSAWREIQAVFQVQSAVVLQQECHVKAWKAGHKKDCKCTTFLKFEDCLNLE